MVRSFRRLFIPHASNNHRPGIIHPEGFFVLTTLVLVFQIALRLGTVYGPLGSVLGFSSSITPDQVLQLTNEDRAKAQLPPLTYNPQLTAAATAKAANMFQDQYWAHISPKGLTPWVFVQQAKYSYQMAGENLARDFSDTPNLEKAWMNSPTHRENILEPRYKDVGIAVVNGKFQGAEMNLIVVLFAQPQVKVAQVLPGIKSSAPTQQLDASLLGIPGLLPSTSWLPEQVLALQTRTTTNREDILTPLQLSKITFLVMLGILLLVLFYDMAIAYHRRTVRLTGKNIAHVILLTLVAILVFMYRGGSLL